jgi:hypothetical protein
MYKSVFGSRSKEKYFLIEIDVGIVGQIQLIQFLSFCDKCFGRLPGPEEVSANMETCFEIANVTKYTNLDRALWPHARSVVEQDMAQTNEEADTGDEEVGEEIMEDEADLIDFEPSNIGSEVDDQRTWRTG